MENFITKISIYRSRHRSLPFKKARLIARRLGLKNSEEWKMWSKTNRHTGMPLNPPIKYRNYWKGWDDFLGTELIDFLSFDDSKKFILTVNELEHPRNWEMWSKTNRPTKIPPNPQITYRDQWKGLNDFLGIEQRSKWPIGKLKLFLRGLIESNMLDEYHGAAITVLAYQAGKTGTAGFHHFLDSIPFAAQYAKGQQTLKYFAYSDDETFPDISMYRNEQLVIDNSISTLENDEEYFNNIKKNTLGKKDATTLQDLFTFTEKFDSISIDDDMMEWNLDYCSKNIWYKIFENTSETIEMIKTKGKTGIAFADAVYGDVLKDYENIENMSIPDGYCGPHDISLMQRYVAYQMKIRDSFCNLSGIGSGKTLSTILASRVNNCKMTLVLCPNDVVPHWIKTIKESFPNSKIVDTNVFDAKYDENHYQFLILNYDKLNSKFSEEHLLKLSHQKIDMLILDEIQYCKITINSEVSKRRKNLDEFLEHIRKLNSGIKVIGLSATIIINTLNEAKSALQIITGKKYNQLVVRESIPNMVNHWKELSMVSVRQIPVYPKYVREFVHVYAPSLTTEQLYSCIKSPLTIEQILTRYRLKEIIKRINGPTIIYTDYVRNIVDPLANAIRKAGFTVGFYADARHDGLNEFLKKKVDVLIASPSISYGINGLQHVCSNLIFNTLPWTHARYEQTIGRILRTAQKEQVTVHHIMGHLGEFAYDNRKMHKIQFKKTLADCVVDGIIPRGESLTPKKALEGVVAMIDRLERDNRKTTASIHKSETALVHMEDGPL